MSPIVHWLADALAENNMLDSQWDTTATTAIYVRDTYYALRLGLVCGCMLQVF